MPKFTLKSPEVRLVIQKHIRDYFFDEEPLKKAEVQGPYQKEFCGLPICDAYNSNLQMKAILARYQRLQNRFANGWESFAQVIDDMDVEFHEVTERQLLTTCIRTARPLDRPDDISPTIGTYLLQKRELTRYRPDFISLAVSYKKHCKNAIHLRDTDNEQVWEDALDLLLFEYVPDEADYTQLPQEVWRARMLESAVR